jgi:hypothetical protein
MRQDSAAQLMELRARIREIEGASSVQTRWYTGVGALDDLIGGVPGPGLIELSGAPGSGRMSLVLSVVAPLTQAGQWVGWIDGERTFYPAAARQLGVDLEHLMLVRPLPDQAVWAAEQLIGSGCFPLVVVCGEWVSTQVGMRWSRAAERGNCSVFIVRARSDRRIPASVRLTCRGRHMTVTRNRGHQLGKRVPVPHWMEGAS